MTLEQLWKEAVKRNPKGIRDIFFTFFQWLNPVTAVKNGWIDGLETVQDPGRGFWDRSENEKLCPRKGNNWPNDTIVRSENFVFRIKRDNTGYDENDRPCGFIMSVYKIK